MTRKRMVIEMGMGTDIRGKDYTKAACRALKDALWQIDILLKISFVFTKFPRVHDEI